MPHRSQIALVCSKPADRSAVAEWLSESGYAPVPLSDFARLDKDLQAHAIEAMVVDTALVASDDELFGLVRRLGVNRPLVVVGDVSHLRRDLREDLNVVERPLTREALLLAVGLALAEGRPVRQVARRQIEPIAASAQGLAVTVREASVRGVGLELAGQRPTALPPYFNLRIPAFGVHVLVKRAWMAPAGPALMRCGGTVEGDMPDAAQPWSSFASDAPAPTSPVRRPLRF